MPGCSCVLCKFGQTVHRTEMCIRASFQGVNSMETSGRVDRKTWNALADEYSMIRFME